MVLSRDKLFQFKTGNSPSVVHVWPFFDDEFVAVAASLTGNNNRKHDEELSSKLAQIEDFVKGVDCFMWHQCLDIKIFTIAV